MHCDISNRSPWLAWVFVAVLLGATFIPAAVIYYEHVLKPAPGGYFSAGSDFADSMNWWGRVANAVIGCLMILGVAIRASTSITIEREKQTFDALLTTPISADSILYAKWVGSMLSIRWSAAWLGLIWAVGIAAGGLHLEALPVVVVAWTVYAAFAATLGLWFSTKCNSSLRATVWTILTMIGLYFGPWLMCWCCGPSLSSRRMGSDLVTQVLHSHLGVLTPPFVLFWLPFSSNKLDRSFSNLPLQDFGLMAASLTGIVVWLLAMGCLYVMTKSAFRKLAHRVELVPRHRRRRTRG